MVSPSVVMNEKRVYNEMKEKTWWEYNNIGTTIQNCSARQAELSQQIAKLEAFLEQLNRAKKALEQYAKELETKRREVHRLPEQHKVWRGEQAVKCFQNCYSGELYSAYTESIRRTMDNQAAVVRKINEIRSALSSARSEELQVTNWMSSLQWEYQTYWWE